MADFNLNNFKSEVFQRDLARPSKFEVIISPPAVLAGLTEGRLVSLFCESSTIPGMGIAVKPLRLYGPSYQRPVGSDYGGDGITMVFAVDAKMQVKKFFDAWLNNVVNPVTYNVNYQDTYTTKIDITQLDNKNNKTYSVSLIDAFPRAINLMDLNMGSSNQVHKLTVTFAYRKWVANNPMSNYNVEDTAANNTRFAAGPVPTVTSRTNSFGTQTSSVDDLAQSTSSSFINYGKRTLNEVSKASGSIVKNAIDFFKE